MKFPVIYRVLGAVNLIFGIISFIIVAVHLDNFLGIHFMGVSYSVILRIVFIAASSLWFLLSAFFWFFGSRFSYNFLYTTLVTSLALIAMMDMEIWKSTKSGDKLAAIILTFLALIYVAFIVVALFYKSVVNYTRQFPRSSFASPVILGFFLLLTGGGLLTTVIIQKAFSNYIPAVIQTTSSSGSMAEYPEVNAIDGEQNKTWWTPFVSSGIGSWFRVSFYNPTEISGIWLHPGSHYPDHPQYGDLFLKNSRLKDAVLIFDNGSTQAIHLEDKDGVQTIKFDPVVSSSVKLKVLATYRGEKWDDLCISTFRPLTRTTFFTEEP